MFVFVEDECAQLSIEMIDSGSAAADGGVYKKLGENPGRTRGSDAPEDLAQALAPRSVWARF